MLHIFLSLQTIADVEFADSEDDLEKESSEDEGSDNSGVAIFSPATYKKGPKGKADTPQKAVGAKEKTSKQIESESDDESGNEFESDEDDDESEAECDSDDEDLDDENDLSSERDSETEEKAIDVGKTTSAKVKKKGKQSMADDREKAAKKAMKASGTDSGVCSERDLSSGNDDMETDEEEGDRDGEEEEKDTMDEGKEGKYSGTSFNFYYGFKDEFTGGKYFISFDLVC